MHLHCDSMLVWSALHCIVMCTVALMQYSVLSHVVLRSAVLAALYWMLCLTLQSTTVAMYCILQYHTQHNMLCWRCCTVFCGSIHCIALCSIQGQTQQSFRIILMPSLLPGNSCPGTEMNGCPLALFLSSSPFLPSSFFLLLNVSHSQNLISGVNVVSLTQQTHMSPWKCFFCGS